MVVKAVVMKPIQLVWASIKSIRLWYLLVAALYGLTFFLDFEIPKEALKASKIIFILASFLQIGITANVLLKESLGRYIAYKAETDSNWGSAEGLIRFGLQTILWSLVVLLAMDNLGIDITALVAGLGVGGIAAALAINNILGDLFASMSIVLDDPFEVGDFIIVGEQMGTVERIGIKSTRVRALSGEQIVFSNSDLLSSRIRNYKRMQERRIVFQLGVIYETEKAKLEKIPEWVNSIIESKKHARFDRCHFKSFGAYSLDYEIVYYMLLPDYNTYMDTQQAINLEIFEKFAQEGVEFAYPTQVEYKKAD